ncbi:MAG: hypothetical protein R2777_09215 [Chitinophagales bacterium]
MMEIMAKIKPTILSGLNFSLKNTIAKSVESITIPILLAGKLHFSQGKRLKVLKRKIY